jgi:hypothetical protein
MSSARRALCGLYLAIAVVALIATWRQNLAFTADIGASLPESFAQFWPALLVNRATMSITVDIFLFSLAAIVWMVLEARRLQVRFVWLYVFFGITVAISVTFPLFLVARERRLAALAAAATEPAPSASDKLGIAFFTVATFAFAIWLTLR